MSDKKISGVWYNQLGSKMTLVAVKDGSLNGKYESAVGDAEDFYILAGRFDADPPSDGRGDTLGWAVSFRNCKRNAHSTATWSGQYFEKSKDGKIPERILTHWLLTSSTLPKDVWKSTNVGHDTFTRKKPTVSAQAEIADSEARALTVDSSRPEDILSGFFHFVRPASHPFFSDTGFNSFSIIQNV
jgi:hypothetical protein